MAERRFSFFFLTERTPAVTSGIRAKRPGFELSQLRRIRRARPPGRDGTFRMEGRVPGLVGAQRWPRFGPACSYLAKKARDTDPGPDVFSKGIPRVREDRTPLPPSFVMSLG